MEILIVDDDPSLLNCLCRLTERLGFEVHSTQSAEDGLDLFLKNQKNLKMVLTDFEMPGMDGYQLAEQIRKVDSEIPIFIMTVNFSILKNKYPATPSINGILPKPFDLTELGTLIEQAGKTGEGDRDEFLNRLLNA